MANDNKVIGYLSPAEMVALMGETGMITVQETATVGGQPVIHAALKVINAQTGEQLPGGLPFTVIMFKTSREPGYSNIAIGTVVPTAELGVVLPRDYFNFSNQHYRFARVFPLDERAFVLQMDLFLHNATREYVKFNFGIWAALFSQVLFDLMGKGGQNLHMAAEAYAAARSDLSQQFVSTMVASDDAAVPETAVAEPVPDETAAETAGPVEAETESLPEQLAAEPQNEIAGSAEEAMLPSDAVVMPVEDVVAEQRDVESEPESEPMLPPKINAVSDGHADVVTAEHIGIMGLQTQRKAVQEAGGVAAKDEAVAETATVEPEAV